MTLVTIHRPVCHRRAEPIERQHRLTSAYGPTPMPVATCTNTEIISALREHLTISAAADALGISRATIYARRRTSEEVAEAILEAREILVDKAEKGLEQLVDGGDFRAIQFTLRTLGRDRGYVERGEPLDLTEDRLDAELARERARVVAPPALRLLPFPRPEEDEKKS